MDNSFQEIEIRVVEKEIGRKSFADIAFLLDRDAQQVRSFVEEYFAAGDVEVYQYKLDSRRPVRAAKPATAKPKEKKKKKAVIISRLVTPAASTATPKRPARGAFKTKPLDLTGCISVRVDEKTIVWGKKGENRAQIIARYKANQSTYKLSKADKN